MSARDTTNKTPACSCEVNSIVSTRKESLGRLKTLNTPIAFKGNRWDLLVIIIRPTGLLFFSASLIALAVGIMEFKK